MNILLANIGNRNIRYTGNFIEKSYDKQQGDNQQNNFYEFTKMIYHDIESEKDNLKIEIIDTVIDKFDIDKIYLFVTNQDKPFHQDTYYVGKIIEYLLKDKYKIELIEQKNDPRNRENSFKFFENFFEKENNLLSKSNLIILGSGGVPAMKEALNFYSVVKNTKNSNIIDVDEKTKEIFSSNIQNEYLKNFDKNILKQMIYNYDYYGACIFIKNSRINNINNIQNYLLYASKRYNFNFEEANKLIDTFKSSFLKKVNLQTSNINEKVKYYENMIIELFDNLEITFKKGEYTSYLGKTFSLQENIIRYLFEKEFLIDTQKDFDKLKELGIPIKEGRNYKYVEISELEKKLNYFYNQYNQSNNDSKLFKKFNYNTLKSLKKIRNNSIVAHGFGGGIFNDISRVNKEIIDFKKDYFGLNENIFDKINKEILLLI